MSAAAVLYRDTGNEEVLTKLNYAVTKLDELQKTSNSPYIGGCSEDCFTKLFSGNTKWLITIGCHGTEYTKYIKACLTRMTIQKMTLLMKY